MAEVRHTCFMQGLSDFLHFLFSIGGNVFLEKFLKFLIISNLFYMNSRIFLGMGIRVMSEVCLRQYLKEGRVELFTQFRKLDQYVF